MISNKYFQIPRSIFPRSGQALQFSEVLIQGTKCGYTVINVNNGKELHSKTVLRYSKQGTWMDSRDLYCCGFFYYLQDPKM